MITPPVNIAFTSLIKINGKLKEFNFRKRGESLYDVNTNDEYSVRYYFQLQKEDNTGWHLTGQGLPAWIANNLQVIVEAMEKEMA